MRRTPPRFLLRALLTLLLLVWLAPWALALDLTQRHIDVVGKLDVASARKVADKLIAFEAQAEAPIHLMITATDGSAQAVLIVADTIRALKSPVVSVVMTQVHGAGAAVATFADQLVMFPGSGLVFSEIEYEGVKKPDPPEPPAPAKEGEEVKPLAPPKPGEVLLQAARTSFLERFHARLAERIQWRPRTLESKIEEGGFILTAAEAVKGKIAARVVDAITYTQLREIKKEIKVITHEKKARTAPLRDDEE